MKPLIDEVDAVTSGAAVGISYDPSGDADEVSKREVSKPKNNTNTVAPLIIPRLGEEQRF